MKIKFTNINFNGYKNIISGCIDDGVGRTSSLSIQLNNINQNDLKEYDDLKKKQNLPYKKNKDSVINLTFVEDKKTQEKKLYINERPWLSGKELLILKKQVPEDLYKKIESAILKGYTLTASLTKRIVKDEEFIEDSFIIKTLSSFKKNILNLSESKEIADAVVEDTLAHKIPPKNIAKEINKYIKQTMEVLFR